MINYQEGSVFEKKVRKCLIFDPFTNTNYKNEIKITEKSKLKELQTNYYSCASNCFEEYENLPILTYHYELSCLCIKSCYEKLNLTSIKNE